MVIVSMTTVLVCVFALLPLVFPSLIMLLGAYGVEVFYLSSGDSLAIFNPKLRM